MGDLEATNEIHPPCFEAFNLREGNRHERVVAGECRAMFLLQCLCGETVVSEWDQFINSLKPHLSARSPTPVPHTHSAALPLSGLLLHGPCAQSTSAFVLALYSTTPVSSAWQTCRTERGVAFCTLAVLATVARKPQSSQRRIIAVWVSEQVCES